MRRDPLQSAILAPLALAIASQASAGAGSGATDGAASVSRPVQAVWLALGVSLLLIVLLLVIVGVNVVRRIQRRRAALDRPHRSSRPARPPDSAWTTAGKRAQPVSDDADTGEDDDPEGLEDTAH